MWAPTRLNDGKPAVIGSDISSGNAYNVGLGLFSLIGEKDRAFSYLEEAVRLGFRDVEWLKVDKDLEPLHSDPRWQGILEMISAKMKP